MVSFAGSQYEKQQLSESQQCFGNFLERTHEQSDLLKLLVSANMLVFLTYGGPARNKHLRA